MSVKLTGFKELEDKLAEMPAKLAKRSTTRAMRAAAKPVRAEIESRAPVDSGGLAGSVRVRLRNRNLTGLAEYGEVLRLGGSLDAARGALRGARRGGNSAGTRVLVRIAVTAPHAHLVEFGTVERFHKGGKSVGVMPANPFVRPAWDASADQALATIRTTLGSEIAKIARES